ncbi:MAG: hypothetical protein HZT43_08295 [Exiguobacterium profundum]|nr:MAG: hypothetical protein HZT43_08295 [Exiguobacterium profundum]
MTDIKLSMARFRRLWADKTITRKEVAAQFGVNKSTATALAQRDGLPQRWFKASDDEVRAAWLDPSISVPEACARLGVAQRAVAADFKAGASAAVAAEAGCRGRRLAAVR